MTIPDRLPAWRALTVLVAAYAAVWITLEGGVHATIGLAAGLALLTAGALTRRLFGGKSLRQGIAVAAAAAGGLFYGLAAAGLTLLLMAVKTGLHAHGAEFTPAEIAWVIRQTPLWATAGLLAGLGLSVLALSRGG